MSFSITVDSADLTFDASKDSLHLTETANGRGTLEVSILSEDPSTLPELDADVALIEDGITIFGGLIDRAPIRRYAGAAMETVISAVGYEAYAERRVIVDGGFPAGMTLLQILTALQPWLAPYGVTLDPAQVTGPTFPELLYDVRTLTEVFDELATLSAKYGEPFVWQIDAFKVLRMYQPSTTPAPFDIVGDSSPYLLGDVTVEPSRDGYANRVYVLVPPKSEAERVETFAGDGSTTTFTLTYKLTKSYGYVTSDGVYETLNVTGDADPATWTYNPGTNGITRNTGAPATSVEIRFDGTFVGKAYSDGPGALTSPWERVERIPDVPSGITLQAIADALLAEAILIPRKVQYPTDGIGLRVGQSQTLTVPMRALDTPGFITDLVTRSDGPFLVRDVSVLAGALSNRGRGWRDVVKAMFEDGTAASSTAAAAAPPPVTTGGSPGAPDKAVQFNRGGTFGGNSAFVYDETTHSLVCGADSSIDAADYEHCFILGKDCHIADV